MLKPLQAALIGLLLLLNTTALAGDIKKLSRGAFLVSTTKLNNTSFQKTVILITHYSQRGATGITINRESQFRLKDLFPEAQAIRSIEDRVFLGGPVRPEAVFVLISSEQAVENMQKIAPDLYFSAGLNAIKQGFSETKSNIRTYAGYAGWAPGQLEKEITRGDWLVIDSEPGIIFSKQHQQLWQTLFTTWSGRWI